MTTRQQLIDYGFTIPDKLDKILKKLPADSFNQIELSQETKELKVWKARVLKAKIWLDGENKTDLTITQKTGDWKLK